MGTDQETVEKTIETKSDSIRQEYAFASDVKLRECKYCRVMIPNKARICPNCKMTLKNHTFLKTIAAVVVIALIGGGCYGLSAYWGLLPDSVVPVWIAQHQVQMPTVSVTTVETTEAAAGAESVAAAEVATASKTEEPEVATGMPKLEETVNLAKSDEAAGAADEETVGTAWVSTVAEEPNGSENNGDKTAKTTEDTADMTDEKETDEKETDEEEADEKIEVTDKEDAEEEAVIPEGVDEGEAAFRADCDRVAYKALLREQEDYLDEAIMLEAEVICQVDGGLFDENIYFLCMTEEKNGIERYYIVRDDRETDETFILDGDFLTIYGQLFGNCKVPANLIETRPTVPAVSMLYCDLSEE